MCRLSILHNIPKLRYDIRYSNILNSTMRIKEKKKLEGMNISATTPLENETSQYINLLYKNLQYYRRYTHMFKALQDIK